MAARLRFALHACSSAALSLYTGVVLSAVPAAGFAQAAPTTVPATAAPATPAAAPAAATAEPAAEPTSVQPPAAAPAPAASAEGSASLTTEAPPAPAAAAAQPSAAPSDADVDALLAQGSPEAALTSDTPSLNLYGFVDFSFLADFKKTPASAINGEPAFSIGHLNVYADADLTHGFRSLFELRFTYLPSGNFDFNTFQRTRTSAADYTSFGRQVSWGGIEIERAWLEYNAHTLLTIRAGQWLTPVGIWNVDHGTPTIIPATRPFVIGNSLFPERQTGIELYGSGLIGDTTLGYHLTFSNGRGPFDSYIDFDTNKGVGARLYATFVPLGTLTVGGSLYRGKFTDAKLALNSKMEFVSTVTEQYDEAAYGADLLWEWEGLHLQSEWIGREVAFSAEGRPVPAPPIVATGLVPDYFMWGAYGLLGYRLPWLASVSVMPFAMLEHIQNGRGSVQSLGGATEVNVFVYGVTVRPVPAVALKAELHQGKLYSPASNVPLSGIFLTAAWSY